MTSTQGFSVDPTILASDDRLADTIESDARRLLAAGMEVSIGRYIAAIPDLGAKPLSADAVIEFVLRSANRRGISDEETATAIAAAEPGLLMAVHRAVLLNQWCGSSSAAEPSATKPPPLALPCDLGPLLSSGRRRYELREQIGEGSQGCVYLAHDRSLSEADRLALVAIKRLGKSSADGGADDEATRARRITHPNVVRVLDRGTSPDGWPFVVMEYVDGGTLDASALRAQCRARTQTALALVAQIADGVHTAHLAGLVHCDLKPTNVLVTRDGTPKATDFGLSSRLHQAAPQDHGPAGSWGFSAPELLRGEPGSRSIPADVYGLAGLLFSLLTDRPPNGGTLDFARAWASSDISEMSVWRGQLLANVPHDVRAVVQRSLRWDAAERHGSAESFAADLRAILTHQPLEWTRPTLLRRARLFARRRPSVVGVGVTAVIAGMVGTGIAVRMQGQATLLEVQLRGIQTIEREQHRRLQEQEEHRKDLIEFADTTLRTFDRTVKSELQESAWSPTLSILDPIMDSGVFEPGSIRGSREWNQQRIAAVNKRLDKLKASHQDDGLEGMCLRDAAAFWSLRIDDHQAAIQYLNDGDGTAARLISPSDSWSVVRTSLRLVAEIKRCASGDEATRATLTARLESARDDLRRVSPTGGLLKLVEKTLASVAPARVGAQRGTPDPHAQAEVIAR